MRICLVGAYPQLYRKHTFNTYLEKPPMARKKKSPHSRPDEKQLQLFTIDEMSGAELPPKKQESEDEHLLQSMRRALMIVSRLDSHRVRLIAMESATLAQGGIIPDQIYKIPALEGISMDGYDFQALYYVSFAKAFPSMIDRIHLPFAEIYEKATKSLRHVNS